MEQSRLSPVRLFVWVARAEAVTWAMLLTGMMLKYGTGTTELGVKIAGPIHGAVFIAFALVVGLLWLDQRLSFRVFLVGLASAVPPFATLWFERYVEQRGLISSSWRLAVEAPRGVLERVAAWLIRRPIQGLATGLVAVGLLFTAALLAGPPVG